MSINVSDEKARAVIDAMERDLFAQLVTRNEFSAEMKLIRQEISSRADLISRDLQSLKDAFGLQIKVEIAASEVRITDRLGKMIVACIAVATAILGAMQFLLR